MSNGSDRDGEILKAKHGQHTPPAPVCTSASAVDGPIKIMTPQVNNSRESRDHCDINSSMSNLNFIHHATNVDVATMDREELQKAVVQAYMRLTMKEMILLLSLRSLQTYGNAHELAFRLAVYDLSHRTDLNTPRLHTPPPSNDISFPESVAKPSFTIPSCVSTAPENQDAYYSNSTISDDITPVQLNHPPPTLPPELWADIFEFVGDWELATALGIHCSLKPSREWSLEATGLDHALLTGHVPYIKSYIARCPSEKPTKHGARCLIRFGYVDVLKLLQNKWPKDVRAMYLYYGDLPMPVFASRFGQTKVLQYWLEASGPDVTNPLDRTYDEEPLEEASRKGNIHVLQWWKDCGLPLKVGLVMDVASSSGQLSVLEWWKTSGLQLEYGRNALRAASYRGEVAVLEWWKRSGLRLIYDKEVLVEATKFNRVDVLEWWKNSGLRVEYLLVEIEAALEDAIGGGREAREWWKERGVRFNVTVREWIEYKVL